MKAECWELIGMSKQRMGSVSASETATGTNTAMQQSYSQTEPLFIAHEYVLGQFYQAIIDASLYIASSQEQSTLSYITSEGQSSFVQVNGTDLKFRDLKVFLTNRPEDTQMFNEIRMLAQPFMQNGGSLYDVIEMYSTKSQRELKKTFKDLRDQQTKQQEQASAQAQQQLDQQNQQAQAQLAQVAEQFQANQAREDYQNELDRINKEVAAINASSRNENALADNDNNGIADALEITNLALQENRAKQDYQTKLSDIHSKNKIAAYKNSIDKEKLQVDRENMANDLAIAKENRKGRNNSK
jgi:hypothetical protein